MLLVKQGNPKNINYFIDEVFNNFPSSWGKDFNTNKNLYPAVNITESKDAYFLDLVFPGASKEDFKVNAENGLLTIGFEQKNDPNQEDRKALRKEFTQQSFKRSFSLDEKINLDGIKAKYENGILYLVLPKKEEVKVSAKEIVIL